MNCRQRQHRVGIGNHEGQETKRCDHAEPGQRPAGLAALAPVQHDQANGEDQGDHRNQQGPRYHGKTRLPVPQSDAAAPGGNEERNRGAHTEQRDKGTPRIAPQGCQSGRLRPGSCCGGFVGGWFASLILVHHAHTPLTWPSSSLRTTILQLQPIRLDFCGEAE